MRYYSQTQRNPDKRGRIVFQTIGSSGGFKGMGQRRLFTNVEEEESYEQDINAAVQPIVTVSQVTPSDARRGGANSSG